MFDVRLRNHLIQFGMTVERRIYPEIVPVDATFPLIIIHQPAATVAQHRDTGLLRRVTKMIKAYSDTSQGAWVVATELRSAIASFPGWITNEISLFEPESKRYVVVTYASFWTRD